MTYKNLLIALISITLISGCAKKASYNENIVSADYSKNKIIIQNVNIFNGKDSLLLENKDVVIEDGIIIDIVEKGQAKTSDYFMIDGTGKTLMPGMIDCHVHLMGTGAVPWQDEIKTNVEYNLKAYLYAGNTTVYELAGMASKSAALSEKIRDKKVLGPALFNTHINITVDGSHPIPLAKKTAPFPLNKLVDFIVPTIDNPDEAKEIIKKYIKEDIDYIKITADQLPSGTPEMQFKQLKALIDEAHLNGYKTFVHIGSAKNAIDAVNAGADVLAHGIFRGKITDDEAKLIAEKKVPVIYTFAGFENVYQIGEGNFNPSKIDKTLIPKEILEPVTGENGKQFGTAEVLGEFFLDTKNNRPYWKENFETLRKNGVRILTGTDSNLPGTYAGATFFQELDILKKLGLSNFEILQGATYFASRAFLENPTFGTIEKGKDADILMLNGNPVENLEHVKNPTLIIAKGTLITKQIN